MTHKTEAQPKALRLAALLDINHHDPHVEQAAAAELRRQHTEIQQLKAQLSALQDATNDRLRTALERIIELNRAHALDLCGDAERAEGWACVREARAALSAAPPPPEREPRKDAENRELAETAMRFVDRAGDVHPGIDDADRICGEFHVAMMEVIEKWHPMPMPPGIGGTNAR